MHCYLGKRKDSPIWYIYEYNEQTGQCKRFSTRTSNRAEAETKLAEHIIKLPQRQFFSGLTVLAMMLRYYEQHGKDRFSVDTIRRVIGLLAEYESETRLDEFDLPRQEAFAAHCGRKPGTRRRYMGVIRAAAQRSFDHGEIGMMPVFVKIKAQDGEGVRPFSLEELSKLFAAAMLEHERLFLLLNLATAPRPGSVLELTWDRVDSITGVVNYDVPGREKTKKRRARAPLPQLARAYLDAHRSVGPVIQYNGRQLAGFKMMFARIAARAKVTGSAYGIRKGVSIWLRRQSVHEWDIKGMLGHAIGGETERYAHYRPEYMRAAAEATEALLREICPPWLASYLPQVVPRETQVLDVIGGRARV